MTHGVEGKVQATCPHCEVPQWATSAEDGMFEIDTHHEPNDSPLCNNGERIVVGPEAVVTQDKIASEPAIDTSWFMN